MGEQHAEGAGIVIPQKERQADRRSRRQPRYNVLLWDSDDHTFQYVEQMLRELFGHSPEQCHQIAQDVDAHGRAIVLTTTREHAELKRDQIHAFGTDKRIEACKGSMSAVIEPEPSREHHPAQRRVRPGTDAGDA